MADYAHDMQLVVDPLNPENVVRDGAVWIYDPADEAGTTPIALKDPFGLPLPNPLTSNSYGFTRPFIAGLPAVRWKSGSFTGFFYSYQGLRDEAIAAVEAAETASAAAATAGQNAADVAEAALAGAVADSEAAKAAAQAAAALVGAPADSAIATAINASGSATKAALSATILTGVEDAANDPAGPIYPIAGRALAGSKRQAPAALHRAQTAAPAIRGIIGMLPDGQGKVFANSGFSASQIGVSRDGATFTWGENLAGGNGVATGFIITPKGEALVSVKTGDNTGPGTLRRSTGFDPATMDATSWATVLTASKTGAHMDGRWCLTERSIAPLNSPGAGAIYACEYDGNRAWQSTDDGVTWTAIFDLQTVLPGATHVHGIGYDKWDHRLVLSAGDNGYASIFYCNVEDIDGLNTPWTLLPGSSSSAWQVTTVVPMAGSVVFLSDASSSGVFIAPRKGYRQYGPLKVAVSLPGAGLIGAHAYQASDDQPAYLTFYQSGSGQTPRILATRDGLSFSTVHTDTANVTTGPGVHSIVGPDLDGHLWAVRNLSGSGELLRLSTAPDVPHGDAAARFGLLGQMYPLHASGGSTSTALTAGAVYVMRITAERGAMVNTRTVRTFQAAAGSGLTLAKAAVFNSAGVQLGVSADVSSTINTAGPTTRDIPVGSFGITAGETYYIAFLVVGTTGPTIARTSNDGRSNAGLSGASLLWGTAATGQTDMPASITPGSMTAQNLAIWFGLL